MDLSFIERVGHRLETAKRVGFDDDTFVGSVDGDICEFGAYFVDDFVEAAIADDANRCAGHRVAEVRCCNLDPGRCADFVNFFESALGSNFSERARLEQGADFGDDWIVLPADNDGIIRADRPVVEDDIDRLPEPFLLFDLEDGADARAGDVDFHLFFHVALGESHHDREQVRNALAGHRRNGDDTDVALEVLDPPVEVSGEALIREIPDNLVETLIEARTHAIRLGVVGRVDRHILVDVPARHCVDLVRRDDEWGLGAFEDVQCLERLWLEAVVDVDDEDGDVRKRAAARAKRRKGVVARRIDKEQSREVEIVGIDEVARNGRDNIERDGCRPDMLGNRACFALDDGRAADLIEQTRLSVIDVSEDGNDWRSQGCRIP